MDSPAPSWGIRNFVFGHLAHRSVLQGERLPLLFPAGLGLGGPRVPALPVPTWSPPSLAQSRLHEVCVSHMPF